MKRTVIQTSVGFPTKDGAGVSLVRVLGHDTVKDFDPILLLDSFDSENPSDYTAGFPMHPHRGIETISYVFRGQMTHKDSLGNEDTVTDGEVQWMTAGSGILHEEKLPASEKLLGVQLWLNLPAKEKMVKPGYHRIEKQTIEEIPLENGFLRLLAGEYKSHRGFLSEHLPLDYYDIHLNAHGDVRFDVENERAVILFTLKGRFQVSETWVEEKTAVKLSKGEYFKIKAGDEGGQILFISSQSLDEPISWGGPIVMNTKEELDQAFKDLKEGVFLQKSIQYD